MSSASLLMGNFPSTFSSISVFRFHQQQGVEGEGMMKTQIILSISKLGSPDCEEMGFIQSGLADRPRRGDDVSWQLSSSS